MDSSVAARLDALAEPEARERLRRCCSSTAWVEGVLRGRPFGNDRALFEAAERVWRDLDRDGWLEAFTAHPRIGERERSASATAQWSAKEQSGMDTATAATRRALAEGNRLYEKKFGHVFLICATGKSAEEMLAALGRRLENDPETELRAAAEEQRKITRQRLEKLGKEMTGR